MSDFSKPSMSRRQLLAMIGTAAGSAAMYQAMTTLGVAQESPYQGPINLDGDPNGASVLILGAGLAGMVAALELRQAGYNVQVLEYREKAGGRNWTLRGGDTYTELGGFTQNVEFDEGHYLNPGPWRIPYHHHAVLDYCKRLGVRLEPFVQVNHNAYLHSMDAFGGEPQRFRHINSDFRGNVAELLSKAVNQNALDEDVTGEDRELLLESLREWGALDSDLRYVESEHTSEFRGFGRDPGGGLTGVPEPSAPIGTSDLLSSHLWQYLSTGNLYEFQMPMFQPVGGMDMIGQAFQRELEDLIRFNTKVIEINQSEDGVTVTYTDSNDEGETETATADWCICTIPFSILSQIENNFSGPMNNAIAALPYAASVKFGLQMRRRFWEEDEAIFGGISYTNLPISLIGYPSTDFNSGGKGVLLGGYSWGPYAYEFTSMAPEERVRLAVEQGARIHPQYNDEFENGIAVGWHRVPWTLGCYGVWTEETREEHYPTAADFDGRVLMAGEHISYIPAWMEGAILSSLDAITRLHERVMNE
ncbi:FAD-dependent oxidoreductase [Chelativorans sp. YIM 93263]|uniref:FAD-dependent oxidoreductase n=1 Tax=Chelativorans sp. YIM 93263 TaxID=2906648 RepID=UPI0023783AC4|nr:FAD-dependent oxidoreductase [Chelativorans sp. YIM 93263]